MPIFYNKSANSPKEIDCIRVDGASDEGPAHDVVQYWWTDWHLAHNKIATLVTSRSSGSSYLNRVELQNGCLSIGHSNAFIPDQKMKKLHVDIGLTTIRDINVHLKKYPLGDHVLVKKHD